MSYVSKVARWEVPGLDGMPFDVFISDVPSFEGAYLVFDIAASYNGAFEAYRVDDWQFDPWGYERLQTFGLSTMADARAAIIAYAEHVAEVTEDEEERTLWERVAEEAVWSDIRRRG